MEEKARGICFWCDERFTPGHKCSKRLYNWEFCFEEESEGENDLVEDEVEKEQEESGEKLKLHHLTLGAPVDSSVSLKAITGGQFYDTINVTGRLGSRRFFMLVDTGSTHNFMDEKLEEVKEFHVCMADGKKVAGSKICRCFTWMVQDEIFQDEFLIIPIKDFDAILGVQWMQPFKSKCCGILRKKTLQFHFHNRSLTLHATPTPKMKWVNGDNMTTTLTKLEHQANEQGFRLLNNEVEPVCNQMNRGNEKEWPVEMHQLLRENADLFCEPKQLPPQRHHDHQIVLKHGAEPVIVRPYRYPAIQKDIMEGIVEEMLAAGIIRKSSSPFSSPVVLVKKKDGTWRLCVEQSNHQGQISNSGD